MSFFDLSPSEVVELRELVQRFRVAYEVARADRLVGTERRAIGFDLTLRGTHADGAEHVLPGCSRCREVWTGLGRIARAILPPPDRLSRYTIRGFDHAFHMAAARGFRNDLEMVLEIRHREGYLESIDDCERFCLDEMKRALESLGAPYHIWRD